MLGPSVVSLKLKLVNLVRLEPDRPDRQCSLRAEYFPVDRALLFKFQCDPDPIIIMIMVVIQVSI